jgi:hypothetical protein
VFRLLERVLRLLHAFDDRWTDDGPDDPLAQSY